MDYNDALLSHSRAVVKIVVNPLTSELYRIRIFYDKEVITFVYLTRLMCLLLCVRRYMNVEKVCVCVCVCV
jgi:hypothetical protein